MAVVPLGTVLIFFIALSFWNRNFRFGVSRAGFWDHIAVSRRRGGGFDAPDPQINRVSAFPEAGDCRRARGGCHYYARKADGRVEDDLDEPV